VKTEPVLSSAAPSAASQQQVPVPPSQATSSGSPSDSAEVPLSPAKNLSVQPFQTESGSNHGIETKKVLETEDRFPSLENPFKISNFAKREGDRVLELEEEVQELRRKLERAEGRLVSVTMIFLCGDFFLGPYFVFHRLRKKEALVFLQEKSH
jgi:hypothetical protein